MRLSFAQNGEDIVLRRAFPGPSGFYVDVGAADPVADSVTKLFSDAGWNGINVEPVHESAARLRADRPRDVTIEAAAGRERGRAVMTVLPQGSDGESSLDAGSAARAAERLGVATEQREVEIVRLADVIEEHAPGRIDFLKIDVEGAERDVLEGADLPRHRPYALVIEAITPTDHAPSHEGWEDLVLGAGYVFTLFDGINRFYAREDAPEVVAALSVPANWLDDWRPAALHALITEREEAIVLLNAHVAKLEALVDERERVIGDLDGQLRRALAQLQTEREAVGRVARAHDETLRLLEHLAADASVPRDLPGV